ncbi:DUF6261 family protein [Capnocytophaga sp. ARDL2]|uniref:DUF6261 family protein n=1 Tax=Capnocytophaga sp. ARDL2 TaxID=3238809 RepID=UPI00355672EF
MNTLELKRLHNAEHLALMTEMLHLVEESAIAQLNDVKADFTKFVELSEEAQKQITKSKYTKELGILDEERDHLYRGMMHRVQSEMLHPDINRRKSAEKVKIVFDAYGRIISSNYEKQTVELQNLILDLRAPNFVQDAKAIGLREWIDALATANENFHTLYLQRRDEYASRESYNMKDIRKALDDVFKKLRDVTAALAILQPSDELETLVRKANVSISKWRDTIAQRSGRRTRQNDEPIHNDEETAD